MNCSSCHEQFAKINYPMATRIDRDLRIFESKQGMLQTYVEKGYMPPNNSLSATERRALYTCLTKEYLDLDTGQGAFIDWLNGNGQP